MSQPITSRFSLIVIHRNNLNILLNFLESAYKVINHELDEIILVDNDSSDGSVEFVCRHYKDIKIIKNCFNKGYAFACNQAIQKSVGKYILICNNDIVLPRDVLDKLIKNFLKNEKVALIGAQMMDKNGNMMPSMISPPSFGSELGLKKYQIKQSSELSLDRPSFVDSVSGAFMAIQKKYLNQIGLMDTDFFFFFEETEFCYRIIKKGFKILYDPLIHIYHESEASSKHYPKERDIEYFRSKIIFWKKTMTKSQYVFLCFYQYIKLFLGVGYYGMNSYIFFKNVLLKERYKFKLNLLSWLIRGKPESWGLPGRDLSSS